MHFAVDVLFKSTKDGRVDDTCLWEEILYLIEASTQKEAEQKVQEQHAQSSHSYKNQAGQLLTWTFDRVYNSYPIEGLVSGAELMSRFLRASEVESMLTKFED
jgi:hypothetical protein